MKGGKFDFLWALLFIIYSLAMGFKSRLPVEYYIQLLKKGQPFTYLSIPSGINLLGILKTLMEHCLVQTSWVTFVFLASCVIVIQVIPCPFNLLSGQLKISISSQSLESFHCKHRYCKPFNTKTIALLKCFTEFLSVPQDLFRKDKAKNELERLNLTSHSLDPGIHLGVRCDIQYCLPQ